MRLRHSLTLLALSVAALHAAPVCAGQRTLVPDDYYQFLDVTEPQVSPDGAAVAYVVTANDRGTDAARSAIWQVRWDGTGARALTHGDDASQPRYSPDGRYLAYLVQRSSDSTHQVWLLDREGGEPRALPSGGDDVSGFCWSPDSRRIAMAVGGGNPADSSPPRPIVIDGYHYKNDVDGYLTAGSHRHLRIVDIADSTVTDLTTDAQFNDEHAAWAPDGRTIAYVSNHDADAERTGIQEIYLIEPVAGAKPRRLAAVHGPNAQQLAFSPDGRSLQVLEGREAKYYAYMSDRLAIIDVATGQVRSLTDDLDQQVSSPTFIDGGSAVAFIVEDHGTTYVASHGLATGRTERLGPAGLTPLKVTSAGGHTVILGTRDDLPPEVFAVEAGGPRQLTAHNRALMAGLSLGSVEDFHCRSRDGTEVQGQIVKPPGYTPGRRYPTVLWIHGGPNGQDQHELIPEGYSPSLERQMLAAQGYVVLAVNYRGSTGRGRAFQQAIFADWGHREVEDLLAAVDYVVANGIADPARLGIGGWSYGGMLTDYTIASDTRFRAAISGAGSGDQVGMYGQDEYALQYNAELGPPWKNAALYVKLSYPLFHADRIRTPTLFMGGDRDFNVPIAGGEQMYLALRTQGVPTELVVYPGEFHVFTRPSFLKDRAERLAAWYAKYLTH